MFKRDITDDGTKIDMLKHCLKSDSDTDEWYNQYIKDYEDSNTSLTWKQFERAFRAQFPALPCSKATVTNMAKEPTKMKLESDQLIKKHTVNGQEVYSHVAFAHKVLQLAQKIGIDTLVTHIHQVYENLPEPIQSQVVSHLKDWK
jgi:hypothetical protein